MTAINRARPVLVSAVAVPLVCALAVAIAWTGYIASDDASYYFGALEWLTDPPFAGSDHWTTRFPLVLSLAAAIGFVGAGPLALGLTAVGWYLAFLLATALFAQRVGGPRVAILAALLIGTLPLVATSASIANCDLPEVAFLLLGLWLLAGEAAGERPRTGAALAAGISFGLAILCRETPVLALAGLGVPFLLGRPVTRRTLLLAAAGAACVLAGEMLFQWLVTGDPLHRYGLAFNHDDTLDRAANLEGNLLVHPALDPLLLLFVNNEFAGLFWLAAVAVATGFHRRLDASQRRMLLLPAAMGMCAFLLVSLLGSKLVLNPRYFTIAAVAAVVAVACWLDRLPTMTCWLVLAASIGFNLLMISVQNANPHWPSQALVRAAIAFPDRAIAAAPEIVRRAELPIVWARVGNVDPSPAAGSLLIVAAAEAPSGRLLARYPSPPTVAGGVVRAAGLESLVPGSIRPRLLSPDLDMVLVDPAR